MEIIGKFKKQLDVVERGNFKSRKVWIVTAENPDFPQTIELEINQAGVDKFDGISEGAPVKCHVNLRGREWTNAEGKTSVFNTLVCWKVEADRTIQPVATQQAYTPPSVEPLNDLPF